jgi:DNA-binding IclR family transcriptional regulator
LSLWGDHGATIVRIHDRHIPILSGLRLGTVLPLYGSAGRRFFLAFFFGARRMLKHSTARHPSLSLRACRNQ